MLRAADSPIFTDVGTDPVKHTRRTAGWATSRQRRPLRGLDDHGVAGCERRTDAPGGEHEGRVPGSHDGGDSRWVPRLDAELSSASGWHTSIPLQQTARFHQARTDGQVELDLDDLWHRAAAAAAVIGVPVDQVSVTVVPTVRSAEGGTFAPRLAFALTPTQLRLGSDNPQLEFRDTAAPVVGATRPNGIGIAGLSMDVPALRVAVGGATAVALGVLMVFVLTGGRRSGTESRISPRSYGGLLLEVEPISSPPGRPVIDVTDFAALSKLAKRYGVLVMYWTRSHVRTFVVHDDGVTYRYRVDVTPRSAPRPGPTPSAASPARRRSPVALDEPAGRGER